MFESQKARKSETSMMPKVIALIGLLALGGGGFMYWQLEKMDQRKELKAELSAAVSSGLPTTLRPVIEKLDAAGLSADPDFANLVTEGRWQLYGMEGIQVGTLDPAALDSVTGASPLPLVIARAERDLMRRDINRGWDLLVEARKKYEREPILNELQARYELAEAEADVAKAGEAMSAFYNTMTALGNAPAEAQKPSKARISTGYARAAELAGDTATSVNNYKDAAAGSPDFLWAAIRSEMSAVAGDADYATTEAAFKAILEKRKDALTPRQKATVSYDLARRAIGLMEQKKAVEALTAAVEADPTFGDAAWMLGQLHLDSGRLSQAEKALETAYKAAPFDLRVVTAKATALLDRNDTAGAEALVAQLPEPYNGFTATNVIKARVARAKGDTAGAATQIEAAVKAKPDLFEGLYEQALIKNAQQAKDAEKAFTALTLKANAANRSALMPVLRAYAAVAPKAGGPKAIMKAAQGVQPVAETEENARALLILGEGLSAAGDKAGAAAVLEQAKKFGDLPRVDELIGQVAAK